MRYGLIGSILIHLVVFGLVIFNFMSRGSDDTTPPPPLPVQIMTPSDIGERQAGKADGKPSLPPTTVTEIKAPDEQATAKKEVEQRPSLKPAEKEALAPPPPPPKAAEAPAPLPKPPVEPVKTETAPQEKPVEKPKPKPVVKPAPKPKPKLEEARKLEDPEPKKAEPRPERTFDPNKIASLLEKDTPPAQRPVTSQAMAETPPAKRYADRQTAVLNRDPNAGTPSGDYDPSRPWRPASSMQDQAMGISGARGAANTGSCADLVQSRIEQNWDLPIGALSAETTIVRLRIELRRDGTLERPPSVMDGSYSPAHQAMADAAVRAAIKGQPYVFPPEQYERCHDMVLRFNPKDMYGG